MSLTLLEAAKVGNGTKRERSVIELFARVSPVLTVLPFMEIPGNAFAYNQESALPGTAFRGVNESFTPSIGIINPQTETLRISGGEIEIDPFIIATEGPESRARQELMQIKAISQAWQQSFFKGSTEADPRDLEGLQDRIVGNQLISAGTTAAGDPLSLLKLDEAIDQVNSPTHLMMNKAMRRHITAAARNPDVSGYITYMRDQFGQRITHYNDIPILVIEDSAGGDTVLPFTEASAQGGTTSTSIYIASFGANKLEGLQNKSMRVRDIGEDFDTVQVKTRIEWYATYAIFNPRAVARYFGISDAPATV